MARITTLVALALLLTACNSDEDLDLDGFISEVDCDDDNADAYPGAPELCNGVDENCNGLIDDGFDFDGDGILSCNEEPIDCNDMDPSVFPGATELCDGIDQDCDGVADNGFDNDGDGLTTCMGDCDDSDADISPMAEEDCDGIDNDCDGLVDETFDFDADGVTRCGPDGLAATADDDCMDLDPTVYPGAAELCDGIDNDCDFLPGMDEFDWDDDGLPACLGDCDDDDPWVGPMYLELECNGIDDDCNPETHDDGDNDGDGHGICEGDCDDSDAAVYPWAAELCNDLDDDCDGLVDEDFDTDFDGVTSCAGDCDDRDWWVYPDAEEMCDEIDNNCDGTVDEGYDDTDGDSILDCLDSEELAADCADGHDNDGDGFADCDDPACVGVGDCGTDEVCHNFADDDYDGYADCADEDCFTDDNCTCEVLSTLDCTTNTLVWADLYDPADSTNVMDTYMYWVDDGYGGWWYDFWAEGPEHVMEFVAPYEGRFSFRKVAPAAAVDLYFLDGDVGCQPDAFFGNRLESEYGYEDEFYWDADIDESLLIIAEHAYPGYEDPDRFTVEVTSCVALADEVCDDGLDNDFDYDTDCADEDCYGAEACLDSVYEIQDGTIGMEMDVVIGGVVVTGLTSRGFYVMDPDGGPNSGVFVDVYWDWQDDYTDVVRGTEVLIGGWTNEFQDSGSSLTMTQVVPFDIQVTGTVDEPAPSVVPTTDLIDPVTAEQWEAVLITVEDVTVLDPDIGYGEWSITDGAVVDDQLFEFEGLRADDTFGSITGVLNYSYDAYKLEPRDADDFVDYVAAPIPASPLDVLVEGDLVVTEFMYDPSHCGDSRCEWIEIYNKTSAELDLEGLVLEDIDGDTGTLGSTVVAANGYVVVGIHNGSEWGYSAFTPASFYGGSLSLGNSSSTGGQVFLKTINSQTDVVTVIDATAQYFDPTSPGVAVQLNANASLDATSNDSDSNWCGAILEISTSGDYGTPGAANSACP